MMSIVSSVPIRIDQTPSPLQHDALSPEELFLQYRDTDDTEAFNALVKRYEKPLMAYLLRRCKNRAMAEDVFQETFMNVIRSKHQFADTRCFNSWLYVVAKHAAIDYCRRHKHHLRVVTFSEYSHDTQSDDPTFDAPDMHEQKDHVEIEEEIFHVRQKVAALAQPLRELVVLVYFEGLKYKEAAEILKIPVGTAKSRLHTALIRLGINSYQRLSA